MSDWETMLHRWQSLTEAEQDCLWTRAEIAFKLTRRDGKVSHPAERRLAADAGCSSAYVTKLATTYAAFPDPASRAKDMSFEHHYLASLCEQPAKALDRAVEEQWSTKQMKTALRPARGSRHPLDTAKAGVKVLKTADLVELFRWLQQYTVAGFQIIRTA